MPILLLIRHGTNDYVKTGRLPGQAPNIHLNEEGRAQAAALAKLLEKHKIAAIYSSQLERAVETAWRIAAPRSLPIMIRSALADTHTGDYTGKTTKELSEAAESKDIWKAIVEKPSEGRLPNGESLLEMQQRVVAELERICAAYPDPEPPKTGEKAAGAGEKEGDAGASPSTEPERQPPTIVAVVMHNDPIKAAIAHFLGMPFDNFQRLGTSPASLSTLMVMDKQIALINLNRVPYQ
ncbi:MAG: histidine phosphatase family protein [Chloroflexi bacterium]|nr:histidine phosphatase family protein [Chloroflexota bacterium]